MGRKFSAGVARCYGSKPIRRRVGVAGVGKFSLDFGETESYYFKESYVCTREREKKVRDMLWKKLLLVMSVLFLATLPSAAQEKQNPEAIKHYNAGVELWKAGDYEKALQEYKQSLALDSTSVQTLYGIGLVYRQLDQLDEAIEYLSKAVRINPRYVDAYYDLGLTYWKQKEYDQAINQFLTVTNFGPEGGSKYHKAYFSLGRLYQLKKELDQAKEALQMALAFDPEYAEAYYYLGEVHRAQGNLTQAIEAYNQAAALDSTDMQIFYRLGLVYKEDGKYERAAEAYQRVSHSKSKLATDSRYRLCVVYNAMGRYDEAISMAQEYLQRKPNAAQALMALGEAHENLGQYKEAVEAYTKASKDSQWKQFATYKIDQLKKYTEEE